MVLNEPKPMYALTAHVDCVDHLCFFNVDADDIPFDIPEGKYALVGISSQCRNLIFMIPDLLLAVHDVAHVPERFDRAIP